MKKRMLLPVSLAVAALLFGVGCGKTEQNRETPTPAPTRAEAKTDGYRIGTAVSDAYVDPALTPTVPPQAIKAVGYEYEYDALTYELVWSDEFEEDGLPDSTKWGYDVGGSGWGNNELQYYTEGDNVTVRDGMLVIEARQEEKGTKSYTSTRLVSRGKGDWLYGRIEVRAKLPDGRGTWPAIWMLPTDWVYGDWPASGEIDIMEHVGYDPGVVHGSIHTKSYYHSIGTQKTATVRESSVSEEFHVYTLEWLPDKIMISMDGKVYFTFCPTTYRKEPTYTEWPFDERMHLLLNLAVGGDWGGVRGVDDTAFPQQLLVDYVRVYQSPEITALTEEEE